MEQPLFITIPFTLEREPPPFESDEIKYPEELVRYFLKKYTKKGDKVFDPFTGLGTTMFVSEEMGRIPYGVEYDSKRFEWVAGQMENWMNVTNGDTADLLDFNLPKMDFCMTSPPYMPRHHKWNPLYSGNPEYHGYDKYLERMSYIYKQIAKLMKRNSYVLVQADNLQHRNVFTPLVRDLSTAIGKVLRLDAEIIVKWDKPRKDYLHTHCLIFKNIKQ